MNKSDLENDPFLKSLLGDSGGNSKQESSIDLLAYWRVINRSKWGIIALVFIASLLAFLYTSALVPLYQAQATMLFNPGSTSNYGTVQDITAQDAYTRYMRQYQYFQSQELIVKSRRFAEQFVDDLELWNDPYFTGTNTSTQTNSGWTALLPEWARDIFGLNDQSNSENTSGLTAEELKSRHRRQAIAAYRGGMRITSDPDVMMFTVGFQSTDPKFSADMANKFADYYIDYDLNLRLESFNRAATWLSDKSQELRTRLSSSEQELQRFKEQENLVSLESGSTILGREMDDAFERLSAARTNAQALTQLRNRLVNADGEVSPLLDSAEFAKYPSVKAALDDAADAQKNVDQLALVYGPKHPLMIEAVGRLSRANEKLGSESSLILASVESDLRTAREEQALLTTRFEQLKAESQELDKKQYDLSALERNQQTDEELFDLFETRFKELNIGSDISSQNIQIVDYAIAPGAAIWPNKPRMMMMAAAFACMLGIGLAFLREFLNRTIVMPDEVEQKLGVPLLGSLAKLDEKDSESFNPERTFIDHSQSIFAESIRSIRTGVMLSGFDNPHKILAITSTVPGEGKTTISMNLACAMGQMEKVLLVDADMRRATLGPRFNIDRNANGLADVTAGLKTLDECIHPFEDGGIDILPAGHIPPNPQELLGSSRFQEVLEEAGKRYDRVIIDTAPTHLVGDPKLISRWASAVVYVVRAESTDYHLAAREIKLLARVDKPVLGVIVNAVSERGYGYYGSYGKKGYGRYGGGYAPYVYGADQK